MNNPCLDCTHADVCYYKVDVEVAIKAFTDSQYDKNPFPDAININLSCKHHMVNPYTVALRNSCDNMTT